MWGEQRCPGSNGRATKIFFLFLNDGLLSSRGISVPHSFVFSNDVTLKEVWLLYQNLWKLQKCLHWKLFLWKFLFPHKQGGHVTKCLWKSPFNSRVSLNFHKTTCETKYHCSFILYPTRRKEFMEPCYFRSIIILYHSYIFHTYAIYCRDDHWGAR